MKIASRLACAAVGAALIGPAMADQVTLRAPDDSLDITGVLTAYDGQTFMLQTDLGPISIPAAQVICEGAGCPAGTTRRAGLEASRVVVLRAKDGSVEIQGALLAFDGVAYRIQSSLGELNIDAATTDCHGAGCPDLRRGAKEIAIAAADGLAPGLIAGLVAGFADQISARAAPGKASSDMVLTGADGARLAEVSVQRASARTGLAALPDGVDMMAAALSGSARASGALPIGPGDGVADGTEDGPVQIERETVLALAAITAIVHPANPVPSLSEAELAAILAGQITDWGALGGLPGPIAIHAPARDSTAGALLDRLVLAPAGTGLSETAQIGDMAAIRAAVAAQTNAIGIADFSADARALPIVGDCGIASHATTFSIKAEDYPLTQRIGLFASEATIPDIAADFVRYATGTAAQKVVAEAGFVDQRGAVLPVDAQGRRFITAMLPSEAEVTADQVQAMVVDLNAAERLSFTYRFERGGESFDSRAQADIRRLAAMIDAGAFAGRELVVVGFTDTGGAGGLNLGLSSERARKVLEAVRAATTTPEALSLPMIAKGYGEMSPLACNDTAKGRGINRRVEIWVRDVAKGNG